MGVAAGLADPNDVWIVLGFFWVVLGSCLGPPRWCSDAGLVAFWEYSGVVGRGRLAGPVRVPEHLNQSVTVVGETSTMVYL